MVIDFCVINYNVMFKYLKKTSVCAYLYQFINRISLKKLFILNLSVIHSADSSPRASAQKIGYFSTINLCAFAVRPLQVSKNLDIFLLCIGIHLLYKNP